MQRLFWTGAFVMCISAAWAQSAKVKGTVKDSVSNDPLYGATIQVGDAIQMTDFENGAFLFELEAGNHVLNVSYLGYSPKSIPVTLTAGQELDLPVVLAEAETILEQATITSSKFEKPLGEVTVSLEVVSPEFIKNTNAVSVNQAIDKIPGVNVVDGQVDIRGGAGWAQGTGSRVLVLLDDLPVLQADAGLMQWRDIPTENLGQVEIVKGAASALYGSSAMNGILNMRTAYPLSKPYTSVTTFYTWYGNPQDSINKWWTAKNAPFETGLQFAHRQKIGKLDLVAGANIFYNSSYIRGGAPDTMPAHDRKGRLTINTRYRATDRLMFNMNINMNIGSQNQYLFWTRNYAGGVACLYCMDPMSIPIRGQSFRVTVDPSIIYYDNAQNQHRLKTRVYYIRNDNLNKQANSSVYTYAEYQFQRRFAKLGNLDLAAGAVVNNTHVVSEVYGNNKFGWTNAAAYFQLDKKFFDKLTVSLGGRYELNNMRNEMDTIFLPWYNTQTNQFEYDTFPTPNETQARPVVRVGMNYQITKGTFLRASWGMGYRYPTILERFVSTSAGLLGVLPNPKLVSETGWSAELGIKQGYKVGKWSGFIDLAGFWSEYFDMMNFEFSEKYYGFQVQNVGDTRIIGGEASVTARGKLGPVQLDFMGGYTFLDPKYQNFDSLTRESTSADSVNVLKYRFRHTAKFDIQATFKGFALGSTIQYYSRVEAIDAYVFNSFATVKSFMGEHSKGSFIWNIRASYSFKDYVKVSFLVNNVMNAEYSLRPGILDAPRNFTVRMDFTF